MNVLTSDFATGALGTACACFFSNPPEVIKTRLQLQGELVKHGLVQKVYTNPLQAAIYMLKNEGLFSLQKGLSVAILYQVTMNSVRLGSYGHIKTVMGADQPQNSFFFIRNLISGAIAGVLGAVFGSPSYFVKVRMQSSSSAAAIGHQHNYKGVIDGFSQIIRSDGILGLWRGVTGQMLRVGIGSAVQLGTYDTIKSFVQSTGIVDDGWRIYLLSSLLAGLCLVVAMNPVDVVATRLYNQPVENGKGKLYDGVFDCLKKSFKAEGVRGLYKGTTAHYLRVGPHTIFTFLFWEKFKSIAQQYK